MNANKALLLVGSPRGKVSVSHALGVASAGGFFKAAAWSRKKYSSTRRLATKKKRRHCWRR